MSYITDRHDIELCPNQGLNVVTCGWQQCHGGHLCNRRFYPHHSFTFVLKGKGYYTIGERTFEIHAGQCFVIFPEISTTYVADMDDPWEYIFAIVNGEDALSLIKLLGMTPENPVLPYRMNQEMIRNLNAMCQAGTSGKCLGYDVIGYFLLCISGIVSDYADRNRKENVADNYVESAIAYMKTHYPYSLSISNVAAYVGIEQSYLYRIFKSKTGISPREWLVKYRLDQAVKMLSDNDRSVTEIALSVGFYDLPHFTKAFIANYGVSPREYRNTVIQAYDAYSKGLQE